MAKKQKFFGWDSYEHMRFSFDFSVWDYEKKEYIPAKTTSAFPAEKDIVFACYETEPYSGSCLVIFKKGRKLFEVCGSHCSCYGLEDQWKPSEVTWKALKMRDFEGWTGREVLEAEIAKHLPN